MATLMFAAHVRRARCYSAPGSSHTIIWQRRGAQNIDDVATAMCRAAKGAMAGRRRTSRPPIAVIEFAQAGRKHTRSMTAEMPWRPSALKQAGVAQRR